MTKQTSGKSTVRLSWKDIEKAVDDIAKEASKFKWDTIVAVMRGGMVPARMVAAKLGVENIVVWDKRHGELGPVSGHVLIVDDICDTGKTLQDAKFVFGAPVAVIVSKREGPDYVGMLAAQGSWVIFPWEGVADKIGARQSEE
jgi:hypoxanthine phosphoribosyltransferase